MDWILIEHNDFPNFPHPNVLSYLMIFQNSSIHRRISLSFFTVEEMGRPGILMYINYNRSQKPASLVWATRATDSSLIVNEISESRKRERENDRKKFVFHLYHSINLLYMCCRNDNGWCDALNKSTNFFKALWWEREWRCEPSWTWKI